MWSYRASSAELKPAGDISDLLVMTMDALIPIIVAMVSDERTMCAHLYLVRELCELLFLLALKTSSQKSFGQWRRNMVANFHDGPTGVFDLTR
jgi:hypothetical protein